MRAFFTRAAAAAVLSFCATASTADDLPRRGIMGIQFGVDDTGSIVVVGLMPGQAAESAGVQPGDKLLSIDGTPSRTGQQMMDATRSIKAGIDVVMTVEREGKPVDVTLNANPRPAPQYPDAEVTLGSVTLENGDRCRTFLARPKKVEGDAPVVFVIQGIPCSSIEFGSGVGPFKGQLNAMVEAGYAVFLVEKPGVGDSEGPPCIETGFEIELEGYLAGMESLKQTVGVDPDRIYLFGVSMGGIMAPLVASEFECAGVCVFGTGITNWAEYIMRNARRQALTLDPSQRLAAESTTNLEMRFLSKMIFDRLTPEEIVALDPAFAAVAPLAEGGKTYAGRGPDFHGELAARSMFEAWAGVAEPTLIMHGEYDWVCDPADQELMLNFIEEFAAAEVELKRFEGMDHGFTTHDSLEASFANAFQGEWDTRVAESFIEWIEKLEASRG